METHFKVRLFYVIFAMVAFTTAFYFTYVIPLKSIYLKSLFVLSPLTLIIISLCSDKFLTRMYKFYLG